MHIRYAKELWDALVAKYDATDAGSELYTMESFHDFRMVNNRPVVEQAHEIQILVKELELLKCPLPDKFVAGCMIAKLPSSWRNFATALKHKRQEISVENLIASFDVEEKTRAKDVSEKGGEGQSITNMVQKNHPHSKNKGKAANKPVKTTIFEKKKTTNAKGACFTCGDRGHFARDCPNHADRKEKASNGSGSKTLNTVTASNTGDGYGNLPTIFSVFQSTSWWLDTGANVHVCADISMYSSYHITRDSSVLMGNGSHSVHGVGTVDLKFTSGNIVQLKTCIMSLLSRRIS
jgi:hypothetical protein